MDLYIDKENLRSFLHSRDKENFGDCQRMLCRQLHIVFNMEKSDVKANPELYEWIKMIGEGRGNSEETGEAPAGGSHRQKLEPDCD